MVDGSARSPALNYQEQRERRSDEWIGCRRRRAEPVLALVLHRRAWTSIGRRPTGHSRWAFEAGRSVACGAVGGARPTTLTLLPPPAFEGNSRNRTPGCAFAAQGRSCVAASGGGFTTRSGAVTGHTTPASVYAAIRAVTVRLYRAGPDSTVPGPGMSAAERQR